MSEKIEQFWVNATADDVAGIANNRNPISARLRDSGKDGWEDGLLAGWKLRRSDVAWIDADGASWKQCQVYREPSWFTDKPDPGLGWRLLEKFPDEAKLGTDECWNPSERKWQQVRNDDGIQEYQAWYRRRIEQLLSGHRWLANGDRLESGDLYYEKGALLEVGHEYLGNKVMLAEAFMRKIEQPKPEPVEPKFAVGQTVKVVGPKQIPALEWSSVGMAQYAGTTQTIERVELLTNPPGIYYHLGEIDNWAFREDYLEAVKPVESKLDEGSKCPMLGCSGVLRFRSVKDCSCHIRPPCSHCADNPPCCPVCEWTSGDPIEPVEPKPQHYVLRVGDSFETPSGHLISVVSPGVEQIEFKLKAGFTAKLPNGQTITATEKGFEVTQ